jgi:hypothetical protein
MCPCHVNVLSPDGQDRPPDHSTTSEYRYVGCWSIPVYRSFRSAFPIENSSMEGDHESRCAVARLLWSPYGILSGIESIQ